jgi:thymidylate synthase ThyX
MHWGQRPDFNVDRGPEGITVELQTWGPQENLFAALYNKSQANWGERPRRLKSDGDLNKQQWEIVRGLFQDKGLNQTLELITFSFLVDGVSRAETHQHVRTRIGAGFNQHGGRDNDWRHRSFRVPETVWRAASLDPIGPRISCVNNQTALDELYEHYKAYNLISILTHHLAEGKRIYAALVDAGIPWQDARRFLPIGTETYLFAHYNYPALKGFLANRLEHIMDWEINCVAQLMLRELRIHCPSLLWQGLGSHSDLLQRAAFAKLDSWPPDGKWPADGQDLQRKRTHRTEQMPFWVLTADAASGGPVNWIPTNGVYPDETDLTKEEVDTLG